MDWNKTRHWTVLPRVYSFIGSLFFRALASQWRMGRGWSTAFSTTTSHSGIGHWRVQPQVLIKWYIVNVPHYGVSGKIQPPYFKSISFQNGNLIASIIPFQWKLLIAEISSLECSYFASWNLKFIIYYKIFKEIIELSFIMLKNQRAQKVIWEGIKPNWNDIKLSFCCFFPSFVIGKP